jgi:choline-sulfatase
VTRSAPNLLVVMADEHAPMFSSTYGHPIVQTPNLDALAADGVTFEAAYCNSPLCVPSRMSFMTGRYVHEIETWDNTTPLRSDLPTWAHYARAQGYDAVLSGKQHFIGPDQLHGFRAQLAQDLHAHRRHPIFPWDGDVRNLKGEPWPEIHRAGPGTAVHTDVDDAVEAAALQYLHDPARRAGPWAACVSFIAPHFPLIAPTEYWDRYDGDIDLPDEPPGSLATRPPYIERMSTMFGFERYSDDLVRRARRAYYALVTYLDAKLGRLIAALEDTGQRQDTLIVYTSDHGDMLGCHGLWRKSNFYEQSARVPLVLSWPGGGLTGGRRVATPVTLVDLVQTISTSVFDAAMPTSGADLGPLARGEAGALAPAYAFSEYLAHGVLGPAAMIRCQDLKLVVTAGDPPMLFDLRDDPGEFADRGAERPDDVQALLSMLPAGWDPVRLESRVRRSQHERQVVLAAGGWA